MRVPQNINLGNILLDFLHYYGEIHHGNAIMCRKPGDVADCPNFYTRPLGLDVYMATESPCCIDDPLNPQNNVGKSTYQFSEIQKIFKVGYQSAFLGCFCDCHFLRHNQGQQNGLEVGDATTGIPLAPGQSQMYHPVFITAQGEQIPKVCYQDESGQTA